MDTTAIVLRGPHDLLVDSIPLIPAGADDVVVQMRHTGISTGTEKLLWTGKMPPFPGMGYPLVPGYEAMGEVVEAPSSSTFKSGDLVFVPGANCYGEVRGLFGAASHRIATGEDRLTRLEAGTGPEGALLALAATAHHALVANASMLPDLIVGHGVLGRLLARFTVLLGGVPPMVWENDPARQDAEASYPIADSDSDPRRDYRCIMDATGDSALLDALIGRLAKGGEIVLAGFYPERVNFAFPMAFLKEARLRVAAEWNAADMAATLAFLNSGKLRLDDLITHRSTVADACGAYDTAFTDSACLKMILDWEGSA